MQYKISEVPSGHLHPIFLLGKREVEPFQFQEKVILVIPYTVYTNELETSDLKLSAAYAQFIENIEKVNRTEATMARKEGENLALTLYVGSFEHSLDEFSIRDVERVPIEKAELVARCWDIPVTEENKLTLQLVAYLKDSKDKPLKFVYEKDW